MIIFFSIDGYIFVQEYGVKRPTYVGLLFSMGGGMVGDEGDETNALVSESTRTKWVVRRLIDYYGWGWGIRTPGAGFRVRSLTTWRIPNVWVSVINFVFLQAPLFILLLQMPFSHHKFSVHRLLGNLLWHKRDRQNWCAYAGHWRAWGVRDSGDW